MSSPPLGLRPPFVYEGYRQRMEDIRDACMRFIIKGHRIPQKWIDEYNILSDLINNN